MMHYNHYVLPSYKFKNKDFNYLETLNDIEKKNCLKFLSNKKIKIIKQFSYTLILTSVGCGQDKPVHYTDGFCGHLAGQLGGLIFRPPK
ncbi:hypothetical protein BpHYR1_024432 [Brachionus plicatilis]|uniref:Uncharacterized protein n=1 Tax=Brachionus plicatilis TaxID=10195 RepID=A0A3M7PMZ4_BRAPC|nr:hypothetical protein BpHYR1_024432 [Brachionus plicatilis]